MCPSLGEWGLATEAVAQAGLHANHSVCQQRIQIFFHT